MTPYLKPHHSIYTCNYVLLHMPTVRQFILLRLLLAAGVQHNVDCQVTGKRGALKTLWTALPFRKKLSDQNGNILSTRWSSWSPIPKNHFAHTLVNGLYQWSI